MKKLKQKYNRAMEVGKLHIGQVVYACKYNSFYMGEITQIVHDKNSTKIQLNNDEFFDILMIYNDKDEALKQLKV